MPDAEPKSLLLKGSEAELERTILWKISLRLLPFLFLLYVVNILDRVNVGMAKLGGMPGDLGLPSDQAESIFGFGAGIFYLGYLLFEVPSNLILQRIGARRWIARIMIVWGLVSAGTLLVTGPRGFYAMRFLLGVGEAGFFPGIILYLSYWFPARERARAVALFMMASPVAGTLGNPLSGAILDLVQRAESHLGGTAGLAAWQWLFLLEGLPAVLLGIATWFYLTDRPEQAGWLTPPERDWLLGRLAQEARQRTARHGLSRWSALAYPRVWLLIGLYFTAAVGTNAFGFFLPTVVRYWFPAESSLEIGLLSAIPSAAAAIGMVVVGRHSDWKGERPLHVAGSALLAVVGWALSATASDRWVALEGLLLAQVGMMSMLPTFWAMATSFLSGTAAVGGIALINSVANLGGWLGTYGFGALKDQTGTFTSGMVVVSQVLFAGALLALCVRDRPSVKRAEIDS